jgi:hypothetical protein
LTNEQNPIYIRKYPFHVFFATNCTSLIHSGIEEIVLFVTWTVRMINPLITQRMLHRTTLEKVYIGEIKRKICKSTLLRKVHILFN